MTGKEKKLQKGAEYAGKIFESTLEAGKEIAKSIPFVGTAIAALDSIIGTAWGMYKDMAIDARIDAINLIIKEKIETEDDISAVFGKLAINCAYAREEEILNL